MHWAVNAGSTTYAPNPHGTFPHDAGIDDHALDCMIIDGARGELDDSANGTHAGGSSSRALPPTVISNGVGFIIMTMMTRDGIRFIKGGSTNVNTSNGLIVQRWASSEK